MDTVLLAELDELGGGTVDVRFTLVNGRNRLGGLQQSLEVLNTKVGDTDSPDLFLGDLFHLGPSLGKVPVLVDNGLTLSVDGV